MLTRRSLSLALAVSPTLLLGTAAHAQLEGSEQPFYQLEYPPFTSLNPKTPFGFDKPTAEQRRKADEIIANTPRGPSAIDIAQSFVDRFYFNDPNAISQWPAPAAWNPLIVKFFGSTSTPVNNDMIAWCAAFANFCIERNMRRGSRSASSQSFLSNDYSIVTSPKRGDLAIFTCIEPISEKSLGIGHVTFFKEPAGERHIKVVGGNQSKDGHSSIISEEIITTSDRSVKRHVGHGAYVDAIMRLSGFVDMS